jgi:hypothetical protein
MIAALDGSAVRARHGESAAGRRAADWGIGRPACCSSEVEAVSHSIPPQLAATRGAGRLRWLFAVAAVAFLALVAIVAVVEAGRAGSRPANGGPTVQFNAAAYAAGEGAGSAPITVTLSGASAVTVTVAYTAAAGTATAADFSPVTGTLTFTPGFTSRRFAVPISPDALHEAGETVELALGEPAGAAGGEPDTATLTILDDDPAPAASFSAVLYQAGEGAGSRTIVVNLSAASGLTATVEYAATAGTAGPADFTPTDGTLTFAPGDTSESFAVTILQDSLDEAEETALLALSNAEEATLGEPDTATLGILDEDPQPQLHFSAAAYSRGESAGPAAITVTLSAASGLTATVAYTASVGTAGAADFTPTSGTLTFAPGDTAESFSVAITPDALDEPDETASLLLGGPTNASLGAPSQATLTIQDDDPAPSLALSAAAYSVAESGGSATITVSLSAVSGRTVTVTVNTAAPGSGDAATAGQDYTASNTNLVFSPGESSETVAVPILTDALDEPAESLLVQLSVPVNASLGAPSQATLTIQDDDPAATLSFSAASYAVEEVEGTITITVQRGGNHQGQESVSWATASGTATAGLDYLAASGTLNFGQNESSKSFTVQIKEDSLYEPDETILLSLSSPVNAVLGAPAAATIVIGDEDPVRLYMPLVVAQPVWEQQGTAFDAAALTVAVCQADENNRLMGADDGLYQWSSGAWAKVGTIAGRVAALAFTNDGETGSCDGAYAVTFEGQVWRRHNGAWTMVGSGFNQSRAIAVRGGEVFLGTLTGLKRATIPSPPSAGHTWLATAITAPVVSISRLPGQQCIFATVWLAGARSNCTPADGSTWSAASAPAGDNQALDAVGLGAGATPQPLLLSTTGRFYYWSGSAWLPAAAPSGNTWAVAESAGRLFAGQSGGVRVNVAGGAGPWRTLGGQSFHVLDLYATGDYLYAATTTGVWRWPLVP